MGIQVLKMRGDQKLHRLDEWLDVAKKDLLNELFSETRTSYPDYEVILVKGKPYFSSDILDTLVFSIYVEESGNLLPNPPSSIGDFLIDESVTLGEQTVLPYINNDDVYMEAAVIFDKTSVKLTNTSISYNDKTVTLSELSKPIENKLASLCYQYEKYRNSLDYIHVLLTQMYIQIHLFKRYKFAIMFHHRALHLITILGNGLRNTC